MVKFAVVRETEREVVLEFVGEDHTIGNLITKMALRKEHVVYATYRIEHPLKPKMLVEIRTDGSVRARDVLKSVLEDVVSLSDRLKSQLQREFQNSSDRG